MTATSHTSGTITRRRMLGATSVGFLGLVPGFAALTSAQAAPATKSALAARGRTAVRAAASGQPLSQTAYWGAYAAAEPYPDCQAHYDLEQTVQSRLKTMSWFCNWSANFPKAASDAKSKGYELLIAWMPILNGGTAVPFSDILAGKYDDYMTSFFTAAKAYTLPVTIRFAHEMNLGKHVWSVGKGGAASTAEFIAAWRYIYQLQKRVGGANVQMLWCMSTSDGAIPAESYFPGASWVDKVGFDAYSGFTSTGWTEPVDLLTPTYQRLTALAPGRPIWLCEVGCRQTTAADVPYGRDKATWTTNLFAISTLPNLSHVVFFNSNKEQDWRLNSSASALAAASTALQSRPIGH